MTRNAETMEAAVFYLKQGWKNPGFFQKTSPLGLFWSFTGFLDFFGCIAYFAFFRKFSV